MDLDASPLDQADDLLALYRSANCTGQLNSDQTRFLARIQDCLKRAKAEKQGGELKGAKSTQRRVGAFVNVEDSSQVPASAVQILRNGANLSMEQNVPQQSLNMAKHPVMPLQLDGQTTATASALLERANKLMEYIMAPIPPNSEDVPVVKAVRELHACIRRSITLLSSPQYQHPQAPPYLAHAQALLAHLYSKVGGNGVRNAVRETVPQIQNCIQQAKATVVAAERSFPMEQKIATTGKGASAASKSFQNGLSKREIVPKSKGGGPQVHINMAQGRVVVATSEDVKMESVVDAEAELEDDGTMKITVFVKGNVIKQED